MVKISTCSAGDLGSIPGSGRSPGEGNGYPLQYSWLENPMDRGAWWATVRGVTKSWTRLSDSNFHLHFDIVNHDDSILIYNMLRDLFHRFSPWIPLSEVDFITLNVEIIKLSFHEVGSPGSGHRVRSEWCWSWIHIRSLNKAFRDLIRFDFVFPQERKV